MALLTLGLNHTTASVELREQVAFDIQRIGDAFNQLKCTVSSVREGTILSTCNRMELFLVIEDEAEDEIEIDIVRWLATYHGLDSKILAPHIYTFRDLRAGEHMMRVASGLDSLIMGEPQVLGQFKNAIRAARDASTCGNELDNAFSKVLSLAKRVRTETAIGRNPVSVAYASVTLASRIFSDLSACKVVLIGAGETIQLVAEHLNGQGVQGIDVINRTLAHAETLAAAIDGYAWSLSYLGERIQKADIVIASTRSTIPVLGKGTVERAQKVRRHKPMFLVDLAVPRDIESEVGDLESVYLYTVDDLEAVVEDGLEQRYEAACQADVLIVEALNDWQREARGYRAVDAIRSLRESTQALSKIELMRALKALEAGSPADEVMHQLSRNLTNKFLHGPTIALRIAAEQGNLSLLKASQQLFSINDFEDTD
jgi:glutamyl-tRNA reductase